MNVPRDGNRITYATGRAGHPLAEASDFNGIAVENLGSGDRPVLPTFDADLSWPGYTFDGWYNADGNKILYLPFAFPYNSTTAYEARWNGDASSQFDFTVMHYRDLNEDRNGNMNGEDPNAWPGADDKRAVLMTPQAMGRWGRPRPLMSLPGLSAEICPMMT